MHPPTKHDAVESDRQRDMRNKVFLEKGKNAITQKWHRSRSTAQFVHVIGSGRELLNPTSCVYQGRLPLTCCKRSCTIQHENDKRQRIYFLQCKPNVFMEKNKTVLLAGYTIRIFKKERAWNKRSGETTPNSPMKIKQGLAQETQKDMTLAKYKNISERWASVYQIDAW
ncbi:hypothetical protein TNCV_4762211 [Trichonephila clavipes]|nr:hypothetical protein TNCV_4762211 [Trichonephila clavipes]